MPACKVYSLFTIHVEYEFYSAGLHDKYLRLWLRGWMRGAGSWWLVNSGESKQTVNCNYRLMFQGQPSDLTIMSQSKSQTNLQEDKF